MRMHHPSLGCIPPSFAISTGSPDHLGQDYDETDHNADMFPPATKYDIPTPGHQELSNVDGDGDDSNSSGQEHESLGCDASSQYLSDDAPPPLSAERSSDDWSPFQNWLEFELMDFLFRQAEMPAKKIDMLLEIWATLLLALHGEPLFTNQKDLYHIINSTSVGEVKWESFVVWYANNGQDGQDSNMAPWMLDSYDVWSMILQTIKGTGRISCQEPGHRMRQIISENPMTAGATLIPIILGSDKTTVSVATGQTDYYPLYLSIGNVRNTVHYAHCSVVVLIGFLAMPKTDYEEQVLLSCIIQNWCPKCLAHWESLDDDVLHHCCEHADAVIQEFDFHKLWDTYGIVGNIVLFTNDFPHADIYSMLSPDILHQLIKGGFKDHLVDWVECYLIHIHGKTQAEKVLDEIDWQIAAVAPYTGLRHFPQGQHFKQWTGDDSKSLMKVYIAAIEGYVPQYIVFTFRAFLEFCYLICWNVITQQMLVEIDDALRHFHLYREVFRNAGVVDTFSLPRQHAMKHYSHLICQCSSNADDPCDQVGESRDMANEIEEQAGSYEEELGDAIDAPRTVGALAAELCLPQLPNILHHFLYSQLFPTDDLDDIVLNECSPYDGSVHVYNSACSTFFALSDLCGLYGMHCEHIRSCPMWRNEGPCFNCIFVVTDPEAEGTLHPCAVVCWFNRMGDGPDKATGMWIICPSYNAHNVPHIAIIHINVIYHAAHLIPVYAAHNINTRDIKPHDSYDTFNSFYVNKFADHHAFEIAF
ncbi:hypothetical protein BKA82DRAFT_4018909 [Pisolithus tinctorius]|nr:hypothetical protein BKA82DRAFT_4018909 [Pisolithus tinctorius]